MKKTNAVRLLERDHVPHDIVSYTVDESDLSAVHVAGQLGEDIRTVFKTLVLQGDRTGHFVCVVPGHLEVDLKLAARATGNKRCDLIAQRDLLPLTGYIRGGCSPIGMKKPLPTYVDQSCQAHTHIYISAGVRGMQVRLRPDDLIRMIGATVCPLCTADEPDL